MNSPEKKPLEITRRSGWSSFLKFVGWTCIVLGSFALVISVMERGSSTEKITLVVTVAAGIQSLFLAFAIDVITDIRWFLKEISSNFTSLKKNQ
jgi:hypothetical protein